MMGIGRFHSRGFSLFLQNGGFCQNRFHRCAKLLNYPTKNKCCVNLEMHGRVFCNYFSSSTIDFPWRRNVVDNVKDDPALHKLLGLMLLKRVLKSYSREKFDFFDFIEGVKTAIQALAHSIGSQDKEGHMVKMLGSDLHNRFRKAFDEMKRLNQKAVLEVESSGSFKVTGVRAVCGSADPGDEYYINFLGQQIITSKHDMFELEKRADYAGISSIIEHGKKLGLSAAEKQLKFQLDVKFSSNERFFIQEKQNGVCEVVFGSKDIVSAKHNVRLETLLENRTDADEHYPFSWKIIDIDFDHSKDNS